MATTCCDRRFGINGRVTEATHPGGLSGSEAAKRLHKLGPVEDRTSRSVASIVAGNVFTLFNAIIGVFFILILSLQLWADAAFGFIAILNSYIGIRQELKAKETLESLALLVAPMAKAIRDGQVAEVRADEVVPGDWIRLEPGDQLVADGEVAESRGLTIDESLLTGEADGIRKKPGQRALSGSFVISGSGYYEVDAVREDSYAEKVAGEARAFRHPPSPLQEEVNQVILYSTYLMIPLAIFLILSLALRDTALDEAAQTATAGLITLIPEGLVLLMSVTLAVAAVRLAKLDTLVQQMAATESLAAVDTICVDKTGTLTSGELELVGVDVADPANAAAAHQALARFAASSGERNRTLEAIAERYPAHGREGLGRGPVLVGVEVERGDPRTARGAGDTYVLGAPDVLSAQGALELPAGPRRIAQAAHQLGPARGRLRPGAGPAAGRPGGRGPAQDRAACAGRARRDPAPRRRRDDRVHARAEHGPEADLGRRPRDGHGGRRLDRGPGRRGRGRGLASFPPSPPPSPPSRSATRSSAASGPSRRRPSSRRSRARGASPR